MKIICASDSFKGSLTSKQIGTIIKTAACDLWEEAEVIEIPMADGGEGTLAAVLNSLPSARKVTTVVQDPLGRNISAAYGLISTQSTKTAVIEMAQASGLTLLSENEHTPLKASSFGTGQLILDALKQGAAQIYIGIGGSATNDGGTGAMEALGVEFYDKDNHLLHGCGENLIRIDHISTDKLTSLAKNASFTVMCDVQNPLTGQNGATLVYGRQKGGTTAMLETLEQGMKHYEQLLSSFSPSISTLNGGGAAGGIGAALSVFLNATLKSGAKTILELYHFADLLSDADLVITGEGSMDKQTGNGKAAAVVGSYCLTAKVPCVAIVGNRAEDLFPEDLPGITDILSINPEGLPLFESMQKAPALYEKAVRGMLSDIQKLREFIGR